jgi:hypothetical protein
MEETQTSTNRTTGEITNKRVMNKDGELRLWLEIALNEEEWTYRIKKLQHPGVPIQPPNPNRPQQQPSTHNDTDNDEEETSHNHSEQQQQNPPPPPPPPRHHRRERSNQYYRHHYQHHPAPPPPSSSIPSNNHYINDYNIENVGRTAHDSLRAMGLRDNATPREIRTQFRVLSMIYHPDKYSPSILDIAATDAQAHFQLLNNAYSYLRNTNN